MIYNYKDACDAAMNYDAPRYSESELREYLEREGADYPDARRAAYEYSRTNGSRRRYDNDDD